MENQFPWVLSFIYFYSNKFSRKITNFAHQSLNIAKYFNERSNRCVILLTSISISSVHQGKTFTILLTNQTTRK